MVRKGVIGIPQDGRMTACSYTVKHYVVLCQDLVQVKMRNFSLF